MVRTRKPKSVPMPDWNKQYHELVKSKEGQAILLDFVDVLTQVIDMVIEQDDTWLTLNLNSKSCQPSVTLHEGRDKSYASGASLEEFIRDFETI